MADTTKTASQHEIAAMAGCLVDGSPFPPLGGVAGGGTVMSKPGSETEPAFRDDPLFMSRRISASYREAERRIREMESRQKSRQVIQGNEEDDPVSDALAEFWDRKAEEIKNG